MVHRRDIQFFTFIMFYCRAESAGKKISAVSSKGMIPWRKSAGPVLNFNEGPVMANCSLRAKMRFPSGQCSGPANTSGADQILRHRFAARAGVEFFVDMLKVGLDRRDRNLERIGDFFGARALHDLAQDVFLTPSEFFC